MKTGHRQFYGWSLLAALTIIVSINWGITYVGASVIIAPMAHDLGIDRGVLGLGSTVFVLCFGFSGPLVARVVTALGTRVTLCIGSLLVALGSLLLATFASRGWQFVTCYGFFLGIGCGFGAIIPAQTCATVWFERKRALALALVLSGGGLGGSISAPLLTRVMAAENGNWRAGWYCVFAAAFVAAALSLILVKNRPEEYGQRVDGELSRDVTLDKGVATVSRVYRTRERWTAAEALRTPTFWLLTLALVGESVPGTAAVAHAVPHLRDLGHTAAAAGAALGVFAVSAIVGELIVGLLCDWIDPRIMWAGCILMIGSAVFIATRAQSDVAMYLFTGMLGFGSGAAMVCWHTTVGNYFGPAAFPSILGAQLPIGNTIAAASPFLVGMVYDARGSYIPAFSVLAAFSALTAVLLYFANPPTHEQVVAVTPAAGSGVTP